MSQYAVQSAAGALLTERFTDPVKAWADFAEAGLPPAETDGAVLVRFLRHDEQPSEPDVLVFADMPPGAFHSYRDSTTRIVFRPDGPAGGSVDWAILRQARPRVFVRTPRGSTASYDPAVPRPDDNVVVATVRTALRAARAQAAELERVLTDHDGKSQ